MEHVRTEKGLLDDLIALRGRLLIAGACDPELPGIAFKTLSLLLLDYLNRTQGDDFGTMWPSVETIAERVGASIRQVRRSLRLLEGRRYIQLVRKSDASRSSFTYAIGGEFRPRSPMTAQEDIGVRPPRTLVATQEDIGVRLPRTPVSPNPVDELVDESESAIAAAAVKKAMQAIQSPLTPESSSPKASPGRTDFQIACEELRATMKKEEFKAFFRAYLANDPDAISLGKRVASEVRTRISVRPR